MNTTSIVNDPNMLRLYVGLPMTLQYMKTASDYVFNYLYGSTAYHVYVDNLDKSIWVINENTQRFMRYPFAIQDYYQAGLTQLQAFNQLAETSHAIQKLIAAFVEHYYAYHHRLLRDQ